MYEEKQKQGIKAQAKALLYRMKNAAIAKPWIIPVAFVAVLILYFFWYIFVVLLVIFAILLLAIKIGFREPSEKEMLEKRRILQDELKIAETKLLQHKLDLKDYQEMIDRNQKQLVGIEARLSKNEGKEQEKKGPKSEQEMQPISSKKRHLLKGLIGRKETIQDEIKIAETKYFKRKINGVTYKEILKEKQRQLIELEAEIKKIYADESIGQIKKDLAEKLKKLGESETKKKDNFAEEVAEDVSEQLERSENAEKEEKEEGQEQY